MHLLEGIPTASKPDVPCQDIREGQSQKTLAYAQALQYWMEKSNPLMPGQPCLLVRCVLELQRVMQPYVAFSNDAVLEGAKPQERSLEGQTQATIPVKTQLAPTKESAKELSPAEVPTEEPAPAEEPTEEAAPTGVSAKEADPAEVSAKGGGPHRGAH